MGTSHRHTPSISGQPNWGNASASVTGVANAVDKSDKLDNNPPATMTPAQIGNKQKYYNNRIRTNYHHAVRNIVRAAGGRDKVSSGTSRAVGHAGIVIASGFVKTFNEIISNGLSSWLQRKGIDTLVGKSCRDVLNQIRGYIDFGIAGLDDTAANEALECVMDSLEERMDGDASKFDVVMNQIMKSDSIKDILDEFFGVYIFSHLSQDFAEKIEYEKGSEVMQSTMKEIKDLIIDDVRRAKFGRSVDAIDWGTPEGEAFIQQEFNRILYILSGNED